MIQNRCETVLSAIHANTTAQAAIHYSPAADLYAAVALCLQGRFFERYLPFPPSTHTQYGDTECDRVGLYYQTPDNCVASWRAGTWSLNLPSAISAALSKPKMTEKRKKE